VDMSERSLYEWYLPVYKACVDAGVGSVMTSFNEIAGIPSTSNRWLLTDLLRNEWNFRGFVVTDYTSINEVIQHGVAADMAEAARLSINAGVDMDMQGSAFLGELPGLVSENKVTEKNINDAVRRILVTKYRMGLFDNPYKYCDKERERQEIMAPGHVKLARELAAKSCVLLKNENNMLPIKKEIRTLAVIGPLADSRADMLGSWSAAGQWEKCVTLLEGIRNKAEGNLSILTSKGCNINDNDISEINDAVMAARKSDFVVLALGENRDMSGEAASRTQIDLPGVQMELARAILKTGKPVAVVLFNGRPLAIEELNKISPAILEAWFGGSQAGNGVADVLFGDTNPSGKLTMSFPRNTGQIPVFYNSKNTGRPINQENPHEKYRSNYLDSPNTPLYPFGFGLSYTTFRYSGIMLDKTAYKGNDQIRVAVEITNTGDRDGEETIQLYVRDLVGEVTRPVKELKGFRKVMIEKGKTIRVEFTLYPSDLSYYHKDMGFTYDPGDFEVFIGTNSSEGSSSGFTIL
ncbi:MAG: glycoside hydrolase family 3 C-terminal domain-containing protein, partial [Bacteroidales bacterium]|nr:glycoside hydrolase family 3 C-terminal domain-containing protein [Bacteroidales bacterium]